MTIRAHPFDDACPCEYCRGQRWRRVGVETERARVRELIGANVRYAHGVAIMPEPVIAAILGGEVKP